jgi:hypothetical protein
MKRRGWMAVAMSALLGLGVGASAARAQAHHDHFDDHDRAAAHDYYKGHRAYFHHDEGKYWHSAWEPDIHEGFVLTPDMRAGWRPVPHDLLVRLGPCPPGYRYVVLGDHVVLVDGGWRIHDVLHLEVNL